MKRLAGFFFATGVAITCGGTTDTSSDASKDAPSNGEGGVDTGIDVTLPTQPYDGTTGHVCTTDSDCHSANGPNVARCSNSVFSPQDYYPTAVCIVPTCSPVSDPQALHYCDGPDAPTSPGVCVPGASGGVCLPKCNYDKLGNAATGCHGKDVCWAYALNPSGEGAGYCWAGCTQDGDCQDGQKCQTDQGLCEVGVSPPTKAIGAACTKSDTNAGVCNCLYGTNDTGYCSSFCIVGGPACAAGYVCDALEYRQYGFTASNLGMAGYCAMACPDGGACPPQSVCTNLLASGPDCVPP